MLLENSENKLGLTLLITCYSLASYSTPILYATLAKIDATIVPLPVNRGNF
jgi:hypothetical protein